MQSKFPRNGIVAPSGSVATAALCAAVLFASHAEAQLSVGGVKIDVGRVSRSRAAARIVLGTIGSARSTSAARVLPTAERYLGVPYKWGGTSPRTGFDCSGFVQYVFAKHGTRLPRTSREMASSGQRLRASWSALKPGDLVMFAEPGERISHVAIYVGNRRIIHASSSGRRVRYDALDTKRGRWFTRRLVAARRVTTRGAALVSDLLAQHLIDTVVPKLPFDPPDHAPLP